MDQKDFELGGRRVDRLTATKAVASDFISRREGDRMGLILFGERAYLQVPLTLDRETVKVLLLEAFIGLAGEKTAIGDAITLAVKRIHDSRRGRRRAGAGATDRWRQYSGRSGAIESGGARAAGWPENLHDRHWRGAAGSRLHSSAVARNINPSADLDEETLTAIADMTGGRYFRAKDTAGLQDIYRWWTNSNLWKSPKRAFGP